MSTQPRRILPLIVAAICALAAVAAPAGDDFPGGKPDRRILKMQEKVDSLFDKGDYERAYFIYREELVPLGDKYAQYMVGYMTLVGKGISADLIAGSAWYRLAAERGDAAFVQARDEVWRLLDAEQQRHSDLRYAELRRDFSDAMIIAGLIEKDLDVLDSRVEVKSIARDLVGAQYYNKETLARENAEAVARVENRLDFLTTALAAPDRLSDYEVQRIQQVEGRALKLLPQFATED